MVQQWIDDPASNYGVLIAAQSDARVAAGLASAEGDPALRPRLRVWKAWTWNPHGFGRPIQHDVSDQALRQVPAFWWYNWGPWCDDNQQIPMLWNANSLDALRHCNDGRPVLVLNEPERPDQGNMSPELAAAHLWLIVRSGWHGEIWCCGTLAYDLDYLDAVVATYEKNYGPGRPMAGTFTFTPTAATSTLSSRSC